MREVVGVTGHRAEALRGADPALVGKRIDDVLEALAARGGRRLVTGLAEGADRLFAGRALEAGWSVDALLPRPRERYEEDFLGPASLDEFRRLLSRCATVDVASPGAPGADADTDYATQGTALVDRASLLLALWDGEMARGPGGTADVVADAVERGRPVIWIHSRPPHEVRFLARDGIRGPFRKSLSRALGPLVVEAWSGDDR